MNITNYIETQYREIYPELNIEYIELYRCFKSERLQEIFATIHYLCTENYKLMNQRLPTGENGNHFWAEPSRKLILAIRIATGMQRALKSTEYAFEIVNYYKDVFEKCEKFLSNSGGSLLPSFMEKIILYYTMPIIIPANTMRVNSGNEAGTGVDLILIGEGSYAKVFSFSDPFYGKKFVVKRAKEELNDKELVRFKQEFEQMKKLYSPYVVEVYRYNDINNEYIMEFMDTTLFKYIEDNNSNLSIEERKSIAFQILKAFSYIHSKNLLHRDISPKNILIKAYDDIKVVKVSDFGLVKTPESDLTSLTTELKGCFNDQGLIVCGFKNYNILHETYALTRLIYFVLTGEISTNEIKNSKIKAFLDKGLSPDMENRFKSANEIMNFLKII